MADKRVGSLAAWLESVGIDAIVAASYAAAFVDLGVDAASDLKMLTESDWPESIKPLHLRKIQGAVEANREWV